MAAIIERRELRDFDWFLTLIAVTIVAFGVRQIYNAQPTENFWQKQIVGLFIALTALVVIAFTDYRRLVEAAPIFYGVGLFLLVLVVIPGVGMKINGHQSWIKIPVVGQFQPSEFVKIPTVLMLAKYFGNRSSQILKLKEFFVGIGILFVPLCLIMLEPDAGTSVTYFPLLAVVLFLSAFKIRWVLLTIVAGLIFVPVAYWAGVKTGKIKTYQQERISNLLDPEHADPKGNGYQTMESIITVGEGGLTGIASNGETSQSALKFLPEAHSDFIFAVTAENTGFIGCVLLLFAYAVLLSRLVAAARETPDRAGMLVIMAITGELAFQIFMNVGMAIGFMPVIGVPLPLMSAGLSSVLATFIAIGFAVSVRMRRFVN